MATWRLSTLKKDGTLIPPFQDSYERIDMNKGIVYGIMVVILVIGLIDTAFSRIPALTNIKWKLKARFRSSRGTVVLVVVMLLCLGAAFYTRLQEKQRINTQASDYSDPVIPSSAMPTENEEADIPDYDLSNYYVYSQLEGIDKDLYEIYYDIVEHQNINGYKRIYPLNDIDEFSYDHLSIAYYALIYDHPEYFYLEMDEFSRMDIMTVSSVAGNVLEISIRPLSAEEKEMEKKFDSAVDAFLADIDLDAPAQEIELQIHDKLIDMVSYDYPALEMDEMSLAHTAYGALVDDGMGNRNAAVCDGYAKAYQYLLQRAGICSTVVSGVAGSDGGGYAGEGDHAWNIVKLDDEWYEVDCCWDDCEFDQSIFTHEDIKYIESLEPQYFAATHYFFNRTTEEMKLLPDAEEYTIVIPRQNGYTSINPCHSSYHTRGTDSSVEGYELIKYIDDLLPVASGTEYGLGL